MKGAVLVLLLLTFFLSWEIGASSLAPICSPAVGANAISLMRSSFLLGLFAVVGGILQGSRISQTVGYGLVSEPGLASFASGIILFTSASIVFLGLVSGHPVPAAFSTTAAVLGAGIAAGGDPALRNNIVLAGYWLSVPVVALLFAATWSVVLRHDQVPDVISYSLLSTIVLAGIVNMPISTRLVGVGFSGTLTTIGHGLVSRMIEIPRLQYLLAASLLVVVVGVYLGWSMTQDTSYSTKRKYLLSLTALMAFSSGGSQIGLATGPVEVLIPDVVGLPYVILLGVSLAGIIAGAWLGSPKVIKDISQHYTVLNPERSIAALSAGFGIVQLSVVLRLPISIHWTMFWSVIGSGSLGTALYGKHKKYDTDRRKIAATFTISVVLVPLSFVFGYIFIKIPAVVFA